MIKSHLNYGFIQFCLDYIKVWLRNLGLKSQSFDVILIKRAAFPAAAQRIGYLLGGECEQAASVNEECFRTIKKSGLFSSSRFLKRII